MTEQEQKDRKKLKNELRLKISALQDEVENNWYGKMSQNRIAKLIGMQPSYLSRLIKRNENIDSIESLETTNQKVQILIEKFSGQGTTGEEIKTLQDKLNSNDVEIKRLQLFEANSKVAEKQIKILNDAKIIADKNAKGLENEISRLQPFEKEVEKLKRRNKWLFISCLLLSISSIFLFIKMSAYQQEIKAIKYWYTNPISTLADTYPFFKDSTEFMLRIDALKEQSMASIKFIPSTIDGCVGDPSNKRMFTTLDTFNLFSKTYVAGKFFIMEGEDLIDDSDLEENYVDSIPTSFIHSVTQFIEDKDVVKDENYLSNILKIRGSDNAKIFANLTYVAVLDTGRQVMVRFPAYKAYDKEEMVNYKFEDRPWSPFKYERDTSYLTQPYGDIRSGLMPVRTYVEYYHKMYEGRKIKIAIGVDLIYAVKEENLFGLF